MHDPSGHEREQPGDVERKGRHGGKGRDGNLGKASNSGARLMVGLRGLWNAVPEAERLRRTSNVNIINIRAVKAPCVRTFRQGLAIASKPLNPATSGLDNR
jgi:hypothetical protein